MNRAMRAAGMGTLMLLAACVAAAEPPAVPPQGDPTTPSLAGVVEPVLLDAAQRTGLARSELVVESVEAVTWADGSLGCPEPGSMYTMALVPGYRIRVRAGSELLDYHYGQRGQLVLCPPGRAVEPAGPVER